jgi:RHS repeat-associated protein
LGNNRVVLDLTGATPEVVQATDYYPFGMPYANEESPERQPYKFGGKELDEMHGLNWYNFEARQRDAILPVFTTMDPLAEKYYSISPYAYCGNNPVNRIDPDGRADFWVNGKVIGNDGVDDQRILVIKTTEKSFGSKEDNSYVEAAGLSKKDQNTTIDFIKANSGNAEAFQKNGIAYTNSIAIESSADNRQAMINEASRDNGKGGTADANNREYGGYIKNGAVVVETPGAVSKLGTDTRAEISLTTGTSTFHSHPSGTLVVGSNPNSGSGAIVSMGGSTTTHSFVQSPSQQDITNAGSHTNYVFGRAGKGYGLCLYFKWGTSSHSDETICNSQKIVLYEKNMLFYCSIIFMLSLKRAGK